MAVGGKAGREGYLGWAPGGGSNWVRGVDDKVFVGGCVVCAACVSGRGEWRGGWVG